MYFMTVKPSAWKNGALDYPTRDFVYKEKEEGDEKATKNNHYTACPKPNH